MELFGSATQGSAQFPDAHPCQGDSEQNSSEASISSPDEPYPPQELGSTAFLKERHTRTVSTGTPWVPEGYTEAIVRGVSSHLEGVLEKHFASLQQRLVANEKAVPPKNLPPWLVDAGCPARTYSRCVTTTTRKTTIRTEGLRELETILADVLISDAGRQLQSRKATFSVLPRGEVSERSSWDSLPPLVLGSKSLIYQNEEEEEEAAASEAQAPSEHTTRSSPTNPVEHGQIPGEVQQPVPQADYDVQKDSFEISPAVPNFELDSSQSQEPSCVFISEKPDVSLMQSGQLSPKDSEMASCVPSFEFHTLAKSSTQDFITSTTKTSSLRQPTTRDLCERHLERLAADSSMQKSEGLSDEGLPVGVFCGHWVVGLAPWHLRWNTSAGCVYQWCILVLVVLASALVMFNLALVIDGSEMSVNEVQVSWMWAPLCFSAIVSMLATCYQGGNRWREMLRLLAVHTLDAGVQERWYSCMRWDFLVDSVLLLAYVAGAFATYNVGRGEALHNEWPALLLAAQVVIGFVHMSMVHSMVTTCRALVALIDNFGNCMLDSTDLREAIQHWKLIQALLRKCTTNMEWMFIGEIASVLFTLPALILGWLTLPRRSVQHDLFSVCPEVFILVGILRLCWAAASISSKCTRIPALVNTLSFRQCTQRTQQHIVEYIVHSNAGFHIADVKLSQELLLKFLYTWSALVFGAWSAFF